MLHAGHVKLFKRCRELAGSDGIVVIGLNTDEFITKYKGKPPVQTYAEREEMILSIPYVDTVIPNDQADGSVKGPIEVSQANLIVIGSDWGRRDYLGQIGLSWGWLEKNNISLVYVPYTYSVSTTMLKERIYGYINGSSNNSRPAEEAGTPAV